LKDKVYRKILLIPVLSFPFSPLTRAAVSLEQTNKKRELQPVNPLIIDPLVSFFSPFLSIPQIGFSYFCLLLSLNLFF
jgi:hypothetical protein